jgi:hypothetical protein
MDYGNNYIQVRAKGKSKEGRPKRLQGLAPKKTYDPEK